MVTKTLKVSIFLIALSSFSFVGAQETIVSEKDTSKKMFAHLDINNDGKITLDEFKKKRIKDPAKEGEVIERYKSIDTDENGSVDRVEFRIFFEGKSQQKSNKKSQQIKEKKG